MAGRTALGRRPRANADRSQARDARGDAADPARSAGAFGYIDDAAIPLIAEALNISKAEALGVVSFYHDFRRAPVDGAVLKLCRAESCQAMGCEDLVAISPPGTASRSTTRTTDRRFMSKPSIASAIARCRPRRCSTASRSAGSTAIGSTRSSPSAQGKSAMTARVFVPADSSALSVGADAVAARDRRGSAPPRPRHLTIVRTGSRGLFWLEPLDRSRDAARPLRLWPDRAGRRRLRCSTAGS